jgi:hypothetical protein
MKSREVTRTLSLRDGASKPDEYDSAPRLRHSLHLHKLQSLARLLMVVNPCNARPIHQGTAFSAPNGDQTPVTMTGEWLLSVDGKNCRFQGIGRIGKGGEIGYLHCHNNTSQEDTKASMCSPDPRPVGKCGLKSSGTSSKAVAYCG